MNRSIQTRLGELNSALAYESVYPIGDDPRLGMAARVVRRILHEPAGEKLFTDILDVRDKPYETGRDIALIALCALNMFGIDRAEELDFPRRFNRADVVDKFVRETIDPRGPWLGDFTFTMYRSVMQANFYERSFPDKMVLLGYRERLGDNPVVIEFGCSLGFLLNALMMDNPPFQKVRVADRHGSLATDMYRNAKVARALMRTVLAPIHPSHCYGVDKKEPWDSHRAKWVRACTLRYSTLLDHKRVDRYNKVEEYRSDSITLVHGDATDPSIVADLDVVLPGRASVGMLSAVLNQYQESPKMVAAIIEHLLAVLDDDALVVVNEFAIPDPDDPTKLIFASRWQPYSFNTMIYDCKRPSRGFHVVASWYNAQCTKVKLAKGWSLSSMLP